MSVVVCGMYELCVCASGHNRTHTHTRKSPAQTSKTRHQPNRVPPRPRTNPTASKRTHAQANPEHPRTPYQSPQGHHHPIPLFQSLGESLSLLSLSRFVGKNTCLLVAVSSSHHNRYGSDNMTYIYAYMFRSLCIWTHDHRCTRCPVVTSVSS